MDTLTGQPAELAFTLVIKRAATGQEEIVNMVGHVLPTQQPIENEENKCL